MTPSRQYVESLVMRVQDEFLSTPALRMPLSQAPGHFGADIDACRAVLEYLHEAGVLSVTQGAYTRFFPRRSARTAVHAA